jgi:hypothetical protein
LRSSFLWRNSHRFLFAFLRVVLYAGFATWEVAEWTFKKN